MLPTSSIRHVTDIIASYLKKKKNFCNSFFGGEWSRFKLASWTPKSHEMILEIKKNVISENEIYINKDRDK